MADSKRKDVFDGVISALSASTRINLVTMNNASYWDWQETDFPGVTIIEERMEKNYLSYPSTSAADMEADITLNIKGYCHNFGDHASSTTLEYQRSELVKGIELAMQSTYISSQVAICTPESDKQDDGIPDNFAIVNCRYALKYFYNHLSP